MAKKKATRRPKTDSNSGGGAESDDLGVHVITKEDIENHFGSSEIETGEAANLPKADVHLQLDGRIWQKAEAEAGRLGLEMSEYVELALDGFKHDAAK